jgi:hypothetical protein
MRVAFLVAELGGSGGMQVIRSHARHLVDAGEQSALVLCGPKPGTLPAADDGVPVVTLDAARAMPFDVAVATWWTTAEALYEVDAARRVVFLQNLEHRFYRQRERPDALGALGVLDLPADFVVVASHMQRLLERLRPDARVWLAPAGINKVQAPRRADSGAGGPLRVLVEGQPTLWFKGVADAVSAVRAMREPAEVTLVVHDPANAGSVAEQADRVAGGLDAQGMARLYAEHDVLLKLSRFEGLGLPPLEAFHAGLPCVLTPFTGSEDYARHGDNALVVGLDDGPGTVAALDLLARDAGLRGHLAAGAVATAAAWPDREQSSARFAAALLEALKSEPPEIADAHRRLLRGRRLSVELGREEERRDATRIAHARWEAERQRALAEAQLAKLQRAPSYRALNLVRRLTRARRR